MVFAVPSAFDQSPEAFNGVDVHTILGIGDGVTHGNVAHNVGIAKLNIHGFGLDGNLLSVRPASNCGLNSVFEF